MNISQKLLLGLLLVIGMTVPIGYMAVSTSQKVLRESIIEHSHESVEYMMDSIIENIFHRVTSIKEYAHDLLLQDFLERSNQAFDGLEDVNAYIAQQDKLWMEAPSGSMTPFMEELAHNELALEIKEKIKAYQEEYGHQVYGEIFITNKYGANAAISGRTSDYYQADEEWWQISKEKGFYIEDVNFDESAGIYSIDIGLRIDDSEGHFLGIIKTVLDISDIAGILDSHKEKDEEMKLGADLMLVNKEGEIIYSTSPFEIFEPLDKIIWSGISQPHKNYFSWNNASDDNLTGGLLYIHEHSHPYKELDDFGWVLIEIYRENQIFAPVTKLKNTIIVMIIGLLFGGIIVAMAIANSILTPIESLREASVAIGSGDLDVSVDVTSHDELGFLAATFNKMVQDIKKQRSQLVERTLMDNLVESIKEGMIMIDREGDVVVMNPQAKLMLGIPKESPDIYKVLREKLNVANLNDALERSRQDGSLVQREIVMPDMPGQALLCNICPVKSAQYDLGTAIILRDITQEKAADASKAEFISTVSHELRTPLAITKEGLSLILDRIAGDITEKQEKIISMAQENIARLSRLINNLLDISKIEAGKLQINNAKLEIVGLTRKVLDEFEIKAKELNLSLQMSFPKEQIFVYADRDKVIQVLTNLINNALKFTNKGGIEISGWPSGDHYRFTVADTGIGISKQDLKKTFSKFEQFGRRSGGGEKGTGLGLSIAKGIVEMHKGKIWVESELGVGTKFHFTLRKFSEDLPLNDLLQERIAEARQAAQFLSLVRVGMDKTNNGEIALAENDAQTYLREIEGLIGTELRRDGDTMVRDSSRCTVLLPNCDKVQVDVVCKRIEKTVVQYMDQKKLKDKVHWSVSSATYPDDGKSSESLLRKLKRV